ncbi:hypothetical protein FIBSPDRAFT_978472 [Athelia psychrophila]|uniref:DUF6593 domain-containing protein n=1 Tax=Athelia psychrophila TaxID=1759441 RepID=A0A166DVE5_9AGAM|nr:hypothetical protein FIBSPDRAFT_978472 [Fibularhizoctonia sp. CBS 109695]
MTIYLTNHANVRNTKFCNDEGQVLYASQTPGPILSSNRVTTISKVVPNNSPDDMSDHFTELAVIEWHPIASSVLKYGDLEVQMNDFMPPTGLSRRCRVFTAPGDGRSFKWKLGKWSCALTVNDDSKTAVAQGHRNKLGIIGKPRPARLEIFSGFQHLADIILITYIFVEKLRKQKE